MAEQAPAPPPLYHLADGMVLGIGPHHAFLIDLARDLEIDVDFRYIAPLEKVSLGWSLEGFEAFIPRLLADGVLAQGPATVDQIIRERLGRLDQMYLPAFARGLDVRARRAYELTLTAHGRRKRFYTGVGQCPTLPETTLRRALLVGDAVQVGPQHILCVGDDDLVSVALAALGHRVTVYDIDDYLLSLLREVSRDLGLDIDAVDRDLRDPLKPSRERFDLFITDPMSNRDCFEIFLSRAFALVKPEGRGFVAVYPPTARTFHAVAHKMRFAVRGWHRRHNRYYSQRMKLHTYESDWVEVAATPETVLAHPPDAFCVPVNLYREDYFHRKPTFVAFYDRIEDTDHARPLFLDMLFDVFEQTAGVTFTTRKVHAGDGWSLVHVTTPEGHVTLHVDRSRRQLSVELFPMRQASEDALRHLVMSAYKTSAAHARVSSDRDVWELRVS